MAAWRQADTVVIDAATGLNPNVVFEVDGDSVANFRWDGVGTNNLQIQVADSPGSGLVTAMNIDGQGNVGIGTSTPTARLEVACPAGFTNVKNAGNQLGCIQTSEANGGTALRWWYAEEYCFENYGGRLPTSGEWFIAMNHFALNGETDDREWNDDYGGSTYGSENFHAVSAKDGSIFTASFENDGYALAFRCWLPR